MSPKLVQIQEVSRERWGCDVALRKREGYFSGFSWGESVGGAAFPLPPSEQRGEWTTHKSRQTRSRPSSQSITGEFFFTPEGNGRGRPAIILTLILSPSKLLALPPCHCRHNHWRADCVKSEHAKARPLTACISRTSRHFDKLTDGPPWKVASHPSPTTSMLHLFHPINHLKLFSPFVHLLSHPPPASITSTTVACIYKCREATHPPASSSSSSPSSQSSHDHACPPPTSSFESQ